ncbi:E3 ubiquitin-protein ligase DTX3L-like [Microtus pennsylvanicus]|uniref:E3 ubiquitin-protein ligase DTX3L-like n=1 Tax=Microtus pennsylvanicus TaxID=10058 RepID=UPI003F6D57FA
MVVDGKPVTIFLETTKKPVEDPRPSPPSLTQPAEAPSSRPPSVTQPAEAPSSRPPSVTQPAEAPSSRPPSVTQPAEAPSSRPPSVTQPAEAPSSRPPSVTQSLDEALSDEGTVYNSDDAIVQEIFLAVTTKLNCKLLSKEQRAHIASVCPGVRSVEGEDGIAKVCGSFKDIEKIHHFLRMQLLESEQKQKCPTHKYTPSDVEREPPNQQDLGRDFSSSDPVTGLDVSERCFEVYVVFLEYFRRALITVLLYVILLC